MMTTTNRRPFRVMLVFGTRPEAIKMMPVARELRRRSGIEATVVVTGQHRQMLDQVFEMFGERPDLDLDVMTPNQGLAEMTAQIISMMGKVFREREVDLVLVQGDTTTAFAAALAAFYARIPVGHVEAGLRSFDLDRPWPEEFNRVAIDCFAELLFAPTETSAANLRNEYSRRGQIFVTGNTGIDSLFFVARRLENEPEFSKKISSAYNGLDADRHLILVTGHRRESFGAGFEQICDGLLSVAARGDVQILYPVHLNPNVRQVVNAKLAGQPRLQLVEPVDYASMVYLMRRASILLTDSGGIQEEGPSIGKPVLVMRDVTERPEALGSGAVQLVGTDPKSIRSAVDLLLGDADEYARRARPSFPFGDGTAAIKIADAIEKFAAV
ncbi:MAG: non-hydrolyzing UDP-N-acetylglucosamine 2-epimerase [Hyphomicrobium sp.]